MNKLLAGGDNFSARFHTVLCGGSPQLRRSVCMCMRAAILRANGKLDRLMKYSLKNQKKFSMRKLEYFYSRFEKNKITRLIHN